MNLGKGLAFSALGALAGAIVWVVLIQLTGWSLWLLAPLVGGGAGFGMMRATQMRGGSTAGLLAVAVTVLAIFGARFFVVNSFLNSELTADTEEESIEYLAGDVANEWMNEDIDTMTEDGDYTEAVYAEAHERWAGMTGAERAEYTAHINEDTAVVGAVLTPIALLFDFGLIGTICTVIAAGGAYKTASTNLEEALIEKGQASTPDEAIAMAAKMRAEDHGGITDTSALAIPESHASTSGGGFFASMPIPEPVPEKTRGFGPPPEDIEFAQESESRRDAA